MRIENKNAERKYIYFNNLKAKKFDTVLIPTVHGATLGIVVELLKLSDSEYDKITSFDARECYEIVNGLKYIEDKVRERKLKDIKREMKDRIKKVEELTLFEMYAEKDPELKKLLNTMKKLEENK